MKLQMISNTSNNNGVFYKLPNRIFFENNLCENFLCPSEESVDYFINNSLNCDFLLVDCEYKNAFSISEYLYHSYPDIKFFEVKPNDLTVTALDILLSSYTNVSNKNILIFGTGNLSQKIAQLLKEKNAKIYIYGRNIGKVNKLVDYLNTFSLGKFHANILNNDTKVKIFISAVSAQEVITQEFSNYLEENSLCIDVGIGNFSADFIKNSLISKHEIRRLDVSLSQLFLDTQLDIRLKNIVNLKTGKNCINGYTVVAGGIMGKNGEVIVDKIVNPSKVIGIANGIGGVKDESDLSAEEHHKIKEVQYAIEQGI